MQNRISGTILGIIVLTAWISLLFDEVVEAHRVVIDTVQVGSHVCKQLVQCVSR